MKAAVTHRTSIHFENQRENEMPAMRKLRKLLRSPGKFFEDAARNRKTLANLEPSTRKSLASGEDTNLPALKPAAPKVSPPKSAAPKAVASKPTAPKPIVVKPAAPKLPVPVSEAPKIAQMKPTNKSPAKKPVGPELNFSRFELPDIRFLIHAGDGVGSEFQFLNWLPEAQHAYQNYAVLIRSWEVYVAVRDGLPTCNLIYASAAYAVEQVVTRMRSLGLVLYVSNTGNNIHLLRYNHLTHAFIGHGDSEKSASCHKFFRVYDEIWVSGQAHIDRFSNANFDTRHVNFVRVGRSSLRPQVTSAIAKIKKSEPRDSRLAQELREEPKDLLRRFLYLPTWEGAFDDSSYASLEHTENILERLCEKGQYRGAIKFHPTTGKRVTHFIDLETKIHARFDQKHVQVIPRSTPHIDAYGYVDFLIADISSVITDFLVTLKPIFIYWPGFKNLRMAESKFSIRDYCYSFSTIEELKSLVQRVIAEDDDDLFAMRKMALDYYIDLNATDSGAFQRQILQACERSPIAPDQLI
ncbi:CDP-glycerol glycerophosphotransferase family protein [Variovorax davisae]|uniref:CDP-glycerol glycerophosphotransferase family protein n=1 Tax=Variovorax davisae TaxID=3053515 RepID=UPI0025783AE2|nr:CDP-glycerol glycerophosphotransferase family protein [Variovorax sp. J22P271]